MKRVHIVIYLLLTAAFLEGSGAQAQAVPAYKNSALPVAQRVEDIISRLSLSQKIKLLMNKGTAIDSNGLKIPAYNWWNECLHGVARAGHYCLGQLGRIQKTTGKPFGVYGVTYGLYGTSETNTLNEAAFVYFRDSVSLQKAKEAGVHNTVTGFSPDVTFAFDTTDDEKAVAFLKENGLGNKKFLCCIPKHRSTPVWLHPHKNRPFDEAKNARNEAVKEHDHIPMRKAITQIVRTTGLKILICHEDETQIAIGKEWILDKLPDDVKPNVVWHNRPWLPDEAMSIYRRSAGLFSNEMHSPIMCVGQGIPAIVCRWEEQSSKGIMWKDIGLGEWLFDFDNEEEVKGFVPAVLEMVKNPDAAKRKAAEAKKFVTERLALTMKEVERISRPGGDK